MVGLTLLPDNANSSAMPIEYTTAEPVRPTRPLLAAMTAGFRCRCPACGKGRMFRAFLKVADRCPACAQELHHHRADDAPPYFVMMIVGHIVVPLVLVVETAYKPDFWLHMAIWPPLALVLALVLLPCVKGAIVGLQWALGMHGFGATATAERLASYGAPSQTPAGTP